MKFTCFIGRNLLVFSFGAFVYGALEILWRGYTHYAMLLLGGILFLSMHYLEIIMNKVKFPVRLVFYTAIITVSEFFTGLFLNVHLGLDIWDYSDKPFNLLGQICLPYSFLWLALSALACMILVLFREMFREDAKK